MALEFVDRGTLRLDMVDRVGGNGDIDTAAIRKYLHSSGSQSLVEGVGWARDSRHVQPGSEEGL